MTYLGILAQQFSSTTSDVQEGTDPPSGTGNNVLDNSKWQGSSPPTDWSFYTPGEGAYVLSAGDIADHQKAQFTSTASDYSDVALYAQEVNFNQGDYIIISAVVRAVSGSSPNPETDPYVIMNHVPYNVLNVLTARPTLESAVVGQRAYYVTQATASGSVTVLFGVDRTGSVTLEAPMVDVATTNVGLRNYVATDPAEVPAPGGLDLNLIPYAGQYIGRPQGFSGNNSSQVRTQPKGARFRVKRTGTIHEWHFHLASNQAGGESTKSRYLGSSPHSYPASWNYRVEIFDATASWATTGSARFSQDFTIYTKDGTNPYNRVICAFTNATHGLSLAVTEGDRLIMKLTNLSGSPEDNYVSINSVSVYGNNGINWVGVGASPPEACGRWHGDENIGVAFSGTATSVLSRAPQHIVAVRYSDGVEDGDIGMDSTMTVMTGYIGGAGFLDQYWTQGNYYAKTSQVLLYAWHRSTTTPSAPLRVQVTGPDITTTNFDFPATQMPSRGGILRGQIQTTGTPLIFTPGTQYRVVLSSVGSSAANGYMLGCSRGAGYLGSATGLYLGTTYSPAPQSPAPSVYNLIDRHQWSGAARFSSNSGGDWTILGWSAGGADLPLAFITNGNVSDTLGGLA